MERMGGSLSGGSKWANGLGIRLLRRSSKRRGSEARLYGNGQVPVKSHDPRKPFACHLRLIPVTAREPAGPITRRRDMKTLRWIVPGAAALVLAAAVTQNASAKVSETINQVYDTSAHPSLRIDNVNGALTLEGWDQNRIEITAVKTAGDAEDLAELKVELRKDGDNVVVHVKYPHENNFWNHGHEGPGVNFTIKVPKGTEIDKAEFVNGDIDITNVTGDVNASSVNGEVSGQKLGGDVNLSTVNGEVELVATSNIKSIMLNSVNGDIRLTLPKKFDARIEAGTIHGDIRAVDGLEVDETSFTGSSMSGVIGKGGMKVDLNTVNGSIRIQHGDEKSGKGDREAD
jgi:Toastrack DUF4097